MPSLILHLLEQGLSKAVFVLGNVKFGQRDPEFLGGPYIYNVEKLPKKLWDFFYTMVWV
jgi:hypothetical protein